MWLLVDLLEREVLEAALLGGVERPLDAGDVALNLGTVQVQDSDAITGHVGEIAFLQDDHVLGVLQDGRHVTGQEPLAVAQPHDQRHVHAGTHDSLRMIVVHDPDGVRATYLPQREAHRFDEVTVVARLDEVGQHLGIGLGNERVAVRAQPVLELHVVLDDPVVDQRQLAGAVRVWVGVGVVRTAVRRPAGVRDTRMTNRRVAVAAEVVGQVAELACPLLDEDVALLGEHRDARGVIAAVLESAESLEQDRGGVARPHVPDDAAHGRPPCQFRRDSASRASPRAISEISSESSPSTMIRSFGSVPEGRTRIRPLPRSTFVACDTAAPNSGSICH